MNDNMRIEDIDKEPELNFWGETKDVEAEEKKYGG